MTAAGTLLHIRDLSLVRNGKRIVNNVSIDVRAGEFVSLVGPNGAGKSSIFRCILGIYTGWSGTILLNGNPIQGMEQRAVARTIAYVPQQLDNLPAFSVREFVLLGRYPHREGIGYGARDMARVDEALSTVDLSAHAAQPVNTLSGGERQRACIAAALAQEPSMLLLDEPVSALDPRHQAEVLHLLRRLNRDAGMAVFWISHDMNHAIQLSSRVAVLAGGAVQFDDTPEALVKGGALEKAFGVPFRILGDSGSARPLVTPEGLYA